MDSHTWDQCALLARCIAQHKMEQVSSILGPILKGINPKIDWKPGKVKKKTQMSAKDKEAAHLQSIAAAGFRIHDG